MEYPEELTQELVRRLRRVEGQVRGIAAMLESGRECRDVVTQIAAASKALDQVGFKLVASGLSACLQEPADGATHPPDPVGEFERLFLKLS